MSEDESITPMFFILFKLHYQSLVLKKFLNLFRRSSSRSPPLIFHRPDIAQSSFSTEPPVPLSFPPAPPSCCITIVLQSAACACPAAIVGAAPVSPLFFSHIFSNPFYFSLLTFFPDSFFRCWLPLSFSPLCCLLPARAVARSLHARAGQRTTRRCPVAGCAHALASRRPRHATAAAAAPTRCAAACLLPVLAKLACDPQLRWPVSVPSPRPHSLHLVPEHPGRH
jgi:hypothetical protein